MRFLLIGPALLGVAHLAGSVLGDDVRQVVHKRPALVYSNVSTALSNTPKSGTMQFEDMIRAGMFTSEMGDFLAAVVRGRMNLLLSGGSGVGKTTLLNNLSRFISESERVVTIEETAELQLQQPDVVSLELPPPNFSGRSEITQRDLLKQSFRLRPDRVIIGEVRGGEVFELLQAMHTGHAGLVVTSAATSAMRAVASANGSPPGGGRMPPAVRHAAYSVGWAASISA